LLDVGIHPGGELELRLSSDTEDPGRSERRVRFRSIHDEDHALSTFASASVPWGGNPDIEHLSGTSYIIQTPGRINRCSHLQMLIF
jgi:hypothetical protein